MRSWPLPPTDLALSIEEVQVWLVPLTVSTTQVQAIAPLLDAQERHRADRLRFALHQQRFVASHAALRLVLSRYLDRPPDRLEFCYSDRGKPALVDASLQFNLSHSGDWALIGVTLDRPVGVDIEEIRPIEAGDLAQRFFHPTEAEAIAHLPLDQQQTHFFRIWTRKEAYLKAIGVGIAEHLQAAIPESIWSVRELEVAPGYVGAIAVQSGLQLRCWQWAW